jgi:hypothetical protein
MEEIALWLIAGIAIVAAIVFVAWILIALLVRVFSIVLVYWVLAFFLAGFVGIVVGVVLPIRVLTRRSKAKLWQITPEDLVDGLVIKHKPISPNAEHGWDSSWPNYMPYQATQDAQAVRREAHLHVTAFWVWWTSKMSRDAATSGGNIIGGFFGALGRGVPRVLWTALMFPPFLGYFIGVWISTLTWILVMAAVGLTVTALQQLGLLAYRLFDVGDRRRLHASVKCPHCYGVSELPGYHCSNPDCNVIHYTMLPGPLGLFTRRCSCGTRLPNTVSAAAKRLDTVCPFCGESLAGGSGARQTVQVALIGSIGAGKSKFIDAVIVELTRVMHDIGGSIEPLNSDAKQYFEQASGRRQQGAPTSKTPYGKSVVGLPFLVQKDKTQVEIQVLDVAGEAFTSWDETAKLRYLDSAEGIVLVLDPLALPEIKEKLQRSTYANSVLLATGDQEEAYGAAIDRLRAESVPLEKRGLAVALSKGDILSNLPVAASLDTGDSAAVRQWLIDNGSDLLVRRFEKDFREVHYFVVDSMYRRELHVPLNPWWVMDWLLTESNSPIKLGQYITPPITDEPPRAPEPPVMSAV